MTLKPANKYKTCIVKGFKFYENLNSTLFQSNQPHLDKATMTLVIIDSNIQDYQVLAQGVIGKAKVQILDSNRDGIEQITNALRHHGEITNLHIVSHGAPGCLYLGNSELSLDTLEKYTSQLKTWFSSNPPLSKGSILLYGCNVAAGDAGAEFLSKLNNITGAKIAASATPTGNAAQGGDWNLEVTTSSMKVNLAFSAETMESYQSTLQLSPELSASNEKISLKGDTPKVLDNQITITSNGTESLNGARIYIGEGFVPAEDRLILGNDTTANSGTLNGIDWTYNNTTGVLSLNGTAPIATYQDLLRQVSYFNASASPTIGDRDINVILGDKLKYKDRYYEFVEDQSIHWTDAKAAAEAKTYFGMQGYLATITSAEEQSFIDAKVTGNGWIGAVDNSAEDGTVEKDKEGEWRWVTGPEGLANGGTGTHFFQGDATGAKTGGTPVKGAYEHWQGTPNYLEPNDYPSNNGSGGEESYAHVLSPAFGDDKGYWNDLPNDGGASIEYQSKGYLVEYGGMPTDPALKIEVNIKVSVDTLPPVLPDSVNIAENTTPVLLPTTDVDGSEITYSLTGNGADAAKFEIDPATGKVVFINAPDYEAKGSAAGTNAYEVEVKGVDGFGNETIQMMTVNVTDVAENVAPIFDGGDSQDISVAENSTVVTTVKATDANLGDTLTYSIIDGGDRNLLAIDPNTGVVTLKNPLDFENLPVDADGDGKYTIQVQVDDGKGGTDIQTINFIVTDVLEDTTAPKVTVDSITTPDSTPKLTGTVDDPTAKVILTIAGVDYPAINNGDGTWTLPDDTVAQLNSGDNPVTVKAVDMAGNIGDGTGTLTLDTDSPKVTIDPVTNSTDSTPDLTGTVDDPTSKVKLVIDGVEYPATVNPEGTWSVPGDTIEPPLADGKHEIKAIATDPQGNTGDAATTATIDTTAPVVSVNPLSTTDTTPELTGKVDDPTAKVILTIAGVDYPATNNGDGTWTLPDDTVAKLADGDTPVTVKAVDMAGNTGNGAGTVTIQEKQPPMPVNLEIPENQTDVGTISLQDDQGNPITLSSFSIIGGEDRDLFVVDSQTGKLSFKNAPDYEQPLDEGKDNQHDLIVSGVHADGNTATLHLNIRVIDVAEDTTAPKVTVDELTTPDSTPKLTGTVDDPTAKVILTIAGVDYPATNNGDGTWTLPDDTVAKLDNGANEVKVKAVDMAGNSGDGTGTVTLDTDSPKVTIDPVTNPTDNTPDLTGTVDDPTSKVKLVIDGVEYPATVNPDGTWTMPGETIASPLADGKHEIQAIATDPQGNIGDAVTTVAIDTTAPKVTVDELTTPDSTPKLTGTVDDPTAKVILTIAGVDYPATNNGDGTWTLPDDTVAKLDNGANEVKVKAVDMAGNSGDGTGTVTLDTDSPKVTIDPVTNPTDNTPDLTGTVDDPTSKVKLVIDGVEYPATVNPDGTWTMPGETIASPLADGKHEIQAIATDPQGNIGDAVTTVAIDTTAPKVTVDELTTPDSTPKLTGTVDDPTAKVIVNVNGIDYQAKNNSKGKWILANNKINPALVPGKYDVKVTATDLAGNAGKDATNDELTIAKPEVPDTIAPVVSVNPLSTSDTTPELTGKVDDPTAKVTVNVNGVDYQANNNSDGSWTLANDKIAPKLGDGNYDVVATAIDPAGNSSQDSTKDELMVDATPPAPTTIDISDVSDPGGNNTTGDSTPEIIGEAEPGSTVEVFDSETSLGTTTTNPSGQWMLIPNQELSNGKHNLSAKATDSLGNVSDASLPILVEVLKAVPDKGSTEVEQPVVIDVLKNDQGEGLIIQQFDLTTSQGGQVTLDDSDTPGSKTDDKLVYTPSAEVVDIPENFDLTIDSEQGVLQSIGDDKFTDKFNYTVKDSNGNTQTAPVKVDVKLDGRLKFTLTGNDAGFINEIGFFKVDADGTLNGLQPSDPGFLEAALKSGKVIFSSLSKTSQFFGDNPTRILEDFNTTDRLNFFLVQNNSLDNALKAIDAGEALPKVFFASIDGNSDAANHVEVSNLTPEEGLSLKWEDYDNGGDGDYNDLEMKVQLTNETVPIGAKNQTNSQTEIIDLQDQTSSTFANFEVASDAGFDNTVGFYRIVDTQGTIRDANGNLLKPSDSGYAQAAMQNRIDLNLTKASSGVDTTLNAGELLAPFIIANGNAEQFLNGNGENNLSASPVAYFSYLDANPDGADHVRSLGDNLWGFEDLPVNEANGNPDFDDFVIRANFNQVGDELIDLAGKSQPQANFQFSSDAGYNNTVGYYVIQNREGTVIDKVSGKSLNPGDAGYAQAAISNKIDPSLNKDNTNVDTILPDGALLAPYLIANGTTDEFLQLNVANDLGAAPVAYFSFLGANPDRADHIRFIDGDTLGFEDLPAGQDDADFNDVHLKINLG
jgi:hypothetical protein